VESPVFQRLPKLADVTRTYLAGDPSNFVGIATAALIAGIVATAVLVASAICGGDFSIGYSLMRSITVATPAPVVPPSVSMSISSPSSTAPVARFGEISDVVTVPAAATGAACATLVMATPFFRAVMTPAADVVCATWTTQIPTTCPFIGTGIFWLWLAAEMFAIKNGPRG